MLAALNGWLSTKIAHARSSKGFTLIEMAIVLVIIGLIIGGILKGQEIIASARSKAVINEINAVRAAVNTYYDRFRALPGDDATAEQRVDQRLNNGNGNGIVGTNAGTTVSSIISATGNDGENYQFFKALVAAGLLNGAEVGPKGTVSATQFGTASSLPVAPITGAGLTLIYGRDQGTAAADPSAVTAHWVRLHKNPQTPAAGMTPRELATIDAQSDDGLPSEGGVRSDGTATCGNRGQSTFYELSDSVTCVGIFYGSP